MKIICEVNSLALTKKILKHSNISMIVLNLDFLSLDTTNMVKDKEAIKIIKYAKSKDIKVAINIDRLFHQNDLTFVKSLLETCPSDYIIYSDLGVYQFLTELGLSDMAIYRAPTYLTNYNDIQIYQKMNSYVVASNQITTSELYEIVKNASSNLIVDALGMACCFYSKRPLVTNYLKFKNIKLKKYRGIVATLNEETRTNNYHLVEDVNGTRVYEEAHYALTKELDNLKCDYILINEFNLDDKTYYNIISLYDEYLNGIISSTILDERIKQLKVPFYKGAYDKKTVLLKEDAND